jgi:hypothetical protein
MTICSDFIGIVIGIQGCNSGIKIRSGRHSFTCGGPVAGDRYEGCHVRGAQPGQQNLIADCGYGRKAPACNSITNLACQKRAA